MFNQIANLIAVAGLVIATASLPVQAAQKAEPGKAASLVAILKSNASQAEKADACRQLAVAGNQDCVPALAALLTDEKLSHMARYALEPIKDASVDAALRDALGQVQGRLQIGIIGSLAMRRDAKAVPALTALLKAADAAVVQAAARALGSIGSAEAIKVLKEETPKASAQNLMSFCEGLFRGAETLSKAGKSKDATAVYEQLFSLAAPQQVKAGALRGMILEQKSEALALLKKYFHDPENTLFNAAVRAAIELQGVVVTPVIASEINQLASDRQVVLLQLLGLRREAGAANVAIPLVKSPDKAVRLAALRALPEIGSGAALPVLAETLRDADRDIAQAAFDALAGFPLRNADVVVTELLENGDPAQRLAAVDIAGRRRMKDSVSVLMKVAEKDEPKTRLAAYKQIGELGGEAEVPALLDRFLKAQEAQEVDAIETALNSVCVQVKNPEKVVERFIQLLGTVPAAQKASLLRMLSALGGPNALKAVRAVANDPDKETRANAIRALGTWRTADAAPALLELAKTGAGPTEKILSLRGYLGFASQADVAVAQRLAMCREAAALTQRPEEKKLLLGALSGIASPDALAMIAPYMSEAAISNEACAAVITAAEKIIKNNEAAKYAAPLLELLGKAQKATDNANLLARAKKAEGQIKRQAGK